MLVHPDCVLRDCVQVFNYGVYMTCLSAFTLSFFFCLCPCTLTEIERKKKMVTTKVPDYKAIPYKKETIKCY